MCEGSLALKGPSLARSGWETPAPRDDAIRRRMEATARRDTTPELRLRSALHRAGYRYWVDRSPLPGIRSRADLVFPRQRVAVFVDGCFWHGCLNHGTMPKNNREWWNHKLEANRARDERVSAALAAAGWTVVRIWEHEELDAALGRVRRALTSS